MDIHTDGIGFVRLFGVFHTSGNEPGQGSHVFAELEGVPATGIDATYLDDTDPGDDRGAPYLAIDSEAPVHRSTVTYLSPVEIEPVERRYPDDEYEQYINYETQPATDIDAEEQLRAQANLTGVKTASLDPTSDCPDCEPLTIELKRDQPRSLVVNLNASSRMDVDGVVRSGQTPSSMELTTRTLQETVDGEEKFRRFAVDLDADQDQALKAVDAKLSTELGGQDVEINASAGSIPPGTSFSFDRDNHVPDEQANPCGVPVAQNLPGGVHAETDHEDPISDIDLTIRPADAETQALEPSEHENFAAIREADNWSLQLQADEIHELGYHVGHTEHESGAPLSITTQDTIDNLEVAYRNETAEDTTVLDARIDNITPGNGLGIHCDGPELSLEPVGTHSGQLFDNLLIQGQNLTIGEREADLLEAEITDAHGPLTLRSVPYAFDDTPTHSFNGFELHGHADARINELRVDTDWDPASVDPPEHCPDGSPGLSGTDVHVTVPIDKVDVAMTTQRPFDHPDRTNWFQLTKTCNQDTLGVELHDVDDVHLRQSHWQDDCRDKTQLWINSSQRHDTDVMTEAWDCQDEEVVEKRLEVHSRPQQLYLETPAPASLLTVETSGVVYEASGNIADLAYIEGSCVNLWLQNVDPAIYRTQMVGYKEAAQQLPAHATCEAIGAGEVIVDGIDRVNEVGAKLSDGSQTLVDGTWEGLTSPLTVGWDIDGYSEQNDHPAFTHLQGTLQTQTLEIQDQEQSNGAVWDLDSLSSASNQANAHIQASLQGQWYDTGSLTAADTLLPGHLDIPDDVIERQCLDPACEEQETLEQAKRRIAEDHLEGHVSVQQDGDWETFPAREWVDNLR